MDNINREAAPDVRSELSALLCGGIVGVPTISYSKQDQAIIDHAKAMLVDYEKSLIHRFRTSILNSKSSESEIQMQFLSDRTRCAMVDNIAKIYSCLIPQSTTYTLST